MVEHLCGGLDGIDVVGPTTGATVVDDGDEVVEGADAEVLAPGALVGDACDDDDDEQAAAAITATAAAAVHDGARRARGTQRSEHPEHPVILAQ